MPEVDASGRSRPITRSHAEICCGCPSSEFSPLIVRSCCSGIHMSGGSPRSVSPKNPGGVIPTTVNGCPSTTNVEPTTAGSPPYVPCHTWWLSTTTGAAAGLSSSEVNTRPPSAPTPSVVK